MKFALPSTPRVTLLTALLAWLAPRAGRAEDAISYKYEDYRESGGRIAVQTQGAHLEQDLGLDTHVKLDGIIDAITGATPTGAPAPTGTDQVPLSNLEERRKAWNLDVSRQFQRLNLDFGFGNSRESDYVSNGWSFNTVTDFNQKNTELLAGVAGTDDKIKVLYSSIAPRQRKHSNDVVLGVTQLLDPLTSVSLDVTWGRQSGYLNDQYKIVEKGIVLFPGLPPIERTFSENRPGYKEKWTVFTGVNRSVPALHGALDASFRYYHDTYNTDAYTAEAAWFQHLTETLILRPSVRLYDQSAARFYYYNLDQTSIVPFGGPPRAAGPFYSSDYRLSALRTYSYALKLIFNATAALQFDVAVEAYRMRGKDGITPQSAYPNARIVTAGVKYSW